MYCIFDSSEDEIAVDKSGRNYTRSRIFGSVKKKFKPRINDDSSEDEIVHVHETTKRVPFSGETDHNVQILETITKPEVKRISPIQEALLRPQLPQVNQEACDCMNDGRLLNDTAVDFYLNYHLLTGINPFFRKQIHLFNSFFYKRISIASRRGRQMTELDVRSWSKRDKLFEKTYLVIPICDHNHWVLVIVCFSSDIVTRSACSPESKKKMGSSSCANVEVKPRPGSIFIFDSLSFGYLSKFTEPIRIFLLLRWKIERPHEKPPDFHDRTIFREIAPKIPRQSNVYDCGVHVLNSFEKFFSDLPDICDKIVKEQDICLEWGFDPGIKRRQVKDLIRRFII